MIHKIWSMFADKVNTFTVVLTTLLIVYLLIALVYHLVMQEYEKSCMVAFVLVICFFINIKIGG